ncbi:MAG TPA: DUF5677 domain-containing protein [Stellaceae bacterium]|nr:DUF5677 domain-containing protein [Stellaceae bacterium]
MGVLQESLETLISQTPRLVLSSILVEKLTEKGIRLRPGELERFANHIIHGSEGAFTVKRGGPQDHRAVEIAISESDIPNIQAKLDRVTKALIDSLGPIVANTASRALSKLRTTWRTASKKADRHAREFEKRLCRRWGAALGDLNLLLALTQEFGAGIIQNRFPRNRRAPPQADALVRLHTRACRIAAECIRLLYGGFADGAMARWRTLFEISTVAYVIAKFGNEIAERYLEHVAIEEWRALKQLEKYGRKLREEAVGVAARQAIERRYSSAIARFGSSFRNQYGWAAKHLEKKDPTFADLVDTAGISHWKPYYKIASHSVHANPKGLRAQHGILSDADILLAGPSNAGLAEPGHCTAISLTQISSVLLELDNSVDNLVMLQAMVLLERAVGKAFGSAHQKLLKDA